MATLRGKNRSVFRSRDILLDYVEFLKRLSADEASAEGIPPQPPIVILDQVDPGAHTGKLTVAVTRKTFVDTHLNTAPAIMDSEYDFRNRLRASCNRAFYPTAETMDPIPISAATNPATHTVHIQGSTNGGEASVVFCAEETYMYTHRRNNCMQAYWSTAEGNRRLISMSTLSTRHLRSPLDRPKIAPLPL